MAARFFLRQLARLLRYHNRVKLPVFKAFREHPEALILRIDAAHPLLRSASDPAANPLFNSFLAIRA